MVPHCDRQRARKGKLEQKSRGRYKKNADVVSAIQLTLRYSNGPMHHQRVESRIRVSLVGDQNESITAHLTYLPVCPVNDFLRGANPTLVLVRRQEAECDGPENRLSPTVYVPNLTT